MRHEYIDSYPDTGGNDDGGSPNVRENWRNRRPYLIVDSRIFSVQNTIDPVADKLAETGIIYHSELVEELLHGIAQPFREANCEEIWWTPEYGPIASQNSKEHPFVAVSTIDLGAFSTDQLEAFARPVENEESFWRFVDAYNHATPQIYPAARTRALEMDLPTRSSSPPTYVNFLLREVDPKDDLPERLTPAQIQALNWVDSAHFGSWKVAQIFWYRDEQSRPRLKSAILGTLEGSRPVITGEAYDVGKEIGRRLKIFGSVEEVKTDYSTDTLEPIPERAWSELPAVKDLMETGRFFRRGRPNFRTYPSKSAS